MRRTAAIAVVVALVAIAAVLVARNIAPRAALGPIPVETIAPRPLTLTPSSGPASGGARITVAGGVFSSTATVTFDGVPATGVTATGAAELAVIVPPHALGAVDVIITSGDGRVVRCPACYTYVTAPAAAAFPLSVAPSGRYLVDAKGTPFRIQGDAAWSLIANLTDAEAVTYLDDRAARGFNAVLVNLLEWHFAVAAPNDRRGDAPFRTPGTLATPNAAYFDHAVSIVDLAASKGFAVFLAYMYLGSNPSEGWSSALGSSANTDTSAYEYGRYIGERFRASPNIVWVAGGDLLPPAGSTLERRTHRIMEGIKSIEGASRLHTAHWSAENASTDAPSFARDVDLNAAYTYRPTHSQVLAAYAHAPAIPTFLIETGYELEGWTAGDRASIRGYEYAAYLSGIGGVFYGHRDVWEFSTETWSSGYPFGHQAWQRSLDSPGAQDMTRLGQLVDALRWWDLVPSGVGGARRVVTSGGGSNGNADYVAAAVASDGAALLVYVPPGGSPTRAFTLDMSALRGEATARWFDPTTGTYRPAGAALANSGSKEFRTPGENAGGATDWVLVVEAR
jgi:hypothetical protein